MFNTFKTFHMHSKQCARFLTKFLKEKFSSFRHFPLITFKVFLFCKRKTNPKKKIISLDFNNDDVNKFHMHSKLFVTFLSKFFKKSSSAFGRFSFITFKVFLFCKRKIQPKKSAWISTRMVSILRRRKP